MADSRGDLSNAERPTIAFQNASLRRGPIVVGPHALPSLLPGDILTLDTPGGEAIGLLLPAVQKVREAAARQTAFDLELRVTGPTTNPTRKVSKIEAITVKQKVSRTGFAYEIKLRKL